MQLALPNSHIRGKADAACHLVLRRHVHAPPPAVLSRFYVPALPALSHTVMEHCASVFALGLPGATLLLPAFLPDPRCLC